MNTRKLLEEYLTTINTTDMTGKAGVVEIFVNPTKEEIKQIIKYDMFRGIAINYNKKLYVFNPAVFHSNILQKLTNDGEVDEKKLKVKDLSMELIYLSMFKRNGEWTAEQSPNEDRKKTFEWIRKYGIGFEND